MIYWVFFGQTGMRALTNDETGGNLPSEFGPWNKFKIIPPPDEASADLASKGFWLFEGKDHD